MALGVAVLCRRGAPIQRVERTARLPIRVDVVVGVAADAGIVVRWLAGSTAAIVPGLLLSLTPTRVTVTICGLVVMYCTSVSRRRRVMVRRMWRRMHNAGVVVL